VSVNEEKVEETLYKVESALQAVRSAVQNMHEGRRRNIAANIGGGLKGNIVSHEGTRASLGASRKQH